MRSPPMCMSCRLHVDTKGWDWVPSEKFSLFTSAWSVWSSFLVTCPDLWLVDRTREGGGKSAEGAAASLCQRPWEGQRGLSSTGESESFLSTDCKLHTHSSHLSGIQSPLCHSGGYFLPDALCHHEVKWREWKSFRHVWLFGTPWTVACQAPLSTEFSRQEYWSG